MVTLPNERAGEDSTFQKLCAATHGLAESFKMDAPQLKVGTLDSLMSLSDDLGKHDSSIEMVIRKIERQYHDIAKDGAAPLSVGSVSPQRFLETFTWDVAKYSKRRALPELVTLILSGVGSVEDELKQLSINLTETTQRLAGLTRKKGGNLTAAPLEEILKPEDVRELIDTEFMRTVFIVVPKSSEAEFLSTYDGIGDEIVGYGGPDWRNSRGCGEPDNNYGPFCDRRRETGSPVVPGSATKILSEGEHVLFSVVTLKGQYKAGYLDEDDVFQQGNYVDFYDAFKASAREKRFIVRDYKKESTASSADSRNELHEVEVLFAEKQAGLERWCRTHYGEALSAWVHLKVIRAFVESVLRYGLSSAGTQGRLEQRPNFMLAVLKLGKNKANPLKGALDKLVHHVETATEEGEEAEYHPYCKLEFVVS